MKSAPKKRDERIRSLARLGFSPRKIAKRIGVNLAVVEEALRG